MQVDDYHHVIVGIAAIVPRRFLLTPNTLLLVTKLTLPSIAQERCVKPVAAPWRH